MERGGGGGGGAGEGRGGEGRGGEGRGGEGRGGEGRGGEGGKRRGGEGDVNFKSSDNDYTATLVTVQFCEGWSQQRLITIKTVMHCAMMHATNWKMASWRQMAPCT